MGLWSTMRGELRVSDKAAHSSADGKQSSPGRHLHVWARLEDTWSAATRRPRNVAELSMAVDCWLPKTGCLFYTFWLHSGCVAETSRVGKQNSFTRGRSDAREDEMRRL